MKSYMMEVSKKEEKDGKNVYVKQGEVEVFYPLLSEMGVEIEPKEYDKEGFPVYSSEKVQFIFDSMLASIKAMARNRLQPGSATLKDGLSIPSTVEELLESGGNQGEALATLREFQKSFADWVKTLGKKESVANAIAGLAKNKAGLALQSNDKKQKFAAYLVQYAGTLNAELSEKYKRPLLALNEACAEADDWE